MRRTFIAAVCLLALLVTSAPASAKHPRRAASGSCPAGSSHLLAADTQAQVYTVGDGFGHRVVHGCLYGQRRSFVLGFFPECGSPSGCVGVETEVLAGPIVAYGAFSITEPALSESERRRRFFVVVRDLRTGRVLRKVPTGMLSPTRPGLVGVGRALALVVKSDGAVAWIAENEVVGASTGKYEVYAADASGTRLLASGPGIELLSLALGGSTVYWSQAGRAASTTLN